MRNAVDTLGSRLAHLVKLIAFNKNIRMFLLKQRGHSVGGEGNTAGGKATLLPPPLQYRMPCSSPGNGHITGVPGSEQRQEWLWRI